MIRTFGKRLSAVTRRPPAGLKFILDRSAAIRKSDILLISSVGDDIGLLPFFCDYYRRLGVNHFLIRSTGSTHALMGWASDQPDVSVLQLVKAARHMAETLWHNLLLQRIGNGHLCVIVGAREFLVYPVMETRSLRDLGEFLKSERRGFVDAILIDAFGNRPDPATNDLPDQDPFAAWPFFCATGYQETNNARGKAIVHAVFEREPGSDPVRGNGPELNRVPIVWWNRKHRFGATMHDLVPGPVIRPADRQTRAITAAILRFPPNAPVGGASHPPLRDLATSERFQSSQQLIHLGLICRGNWL